MVHVNNGVVSHNDMWLACGVRGQFIHLSVNHDALQSACQFDGCELTGMLHVQPILPPISVITMQVCQVQIDCVSILMYSAWL